jgi:rod shape-determining protein MreC
MRYLYLAMLRQKDHLSLILAVFISITLLFTNESKDIRLLRAKANDFFAVLYAPMAWVRALGTLEEEANLLREKNLQLTLQMESMLHLAEENRHLRDMLNFKRDSRISLQPAKVIHKGLTSNMVSLTVDVGKREGISENNPVLTPKGIIGKTVLVGETSSVVQMISDHNFRISVRILPGGSTGILRWLNDDVCEIREVQKNAKVGVGDAIVTSGFSDYFPNDIPVGYVIGIRDERASFQKIVSVKMHNDLSSLLNVFIITEVVDAQ